MADVSVFFRDIERAKHYDAITKHLPFEKIEELVSKSKSYLLKVSRDIHTKKHKVYWSDTHLSFNDTPYMVVNQKSFDCQHGKDFFFKKISKNKRIYKKNRIHGIAFMVSLINKEDLTSTSFEKKLLDHLYDCYKQGRLIPFLSAKENVKRNTAKSISFELFRSCGMPWAKQKARSVELQMAECDSCMEWFHRKCQRIPDQVFQRTMEWLCNACQKLRKR